MRFFLIVFHLLTTLAMIGIILLQKGEDAGAGISGNSAGMFSARGAKNLLSRTTAILATLFFLNCLVLAILVRRDSRLGTPEMEKTSSKQETSKVSTTKSVTIETATPLKAMPSLPQSSPQEVPKSKPSQPSKLPKTR